MGVATSVDQRALLIQSGGMTSMTISTGYSGAGEDFAWVIPTPVAPRIEDVAEAGDDGLRAFDVLESMTAPQIGRSSGGKRPGCSGFAMKGEMAADNGRSMVRVLGQVTLEHYEVSVLDATGSGALLGWLRSNGYKVSDDARHTLSQYISEGWTFVAVKLRPKEQRPYQNEFLTPLTIRLRTDKLVFPMRISAVSSQSQVAIVLYTLARSTMSSPNYHTVNLIHKATIGMDEDPMEYIEWAIFETARGQGVGLARICAMEFYGGHQDTFEKIHGSPFDKEAEYYLTRLETRLAPRDMKQDIRLRPDRVPQSFRVHITQVAANDDGTRYASLPAWALPVVMVGAVYLGARRKKFK